MKKTRRIAGTAAGLALFALVALPLAAQEDGGLRFNFGLSARVEAITNPGLSTPADPDTTRLTSRLSFGLTDSTRVGSIALSAAGSLSSDSDEDSPDGLIDPDFRLSLKRIGASSSVELAAFLRENDLDTLRGLVLDPVTGGVTEDVIGDGTQRSTGGTLTFDFGTDGPWGGSLTAGLTDTTYSGTTPEADTLRTNLGGSLRFALNPATEVTASLTWSRYDEAGATPRDTLRPELGIRRELPSGFALASAFAEDTEDGTRSGLSFGRNWALPDSALTLRLGLTRGVTGDLSPTAALDWQQDLPRGNLTASLRRDVTAGDGDAETTATTASLGLSQTLSPLGSVRFGLTASESEATTTAATTRSAAFSATYSHSLTQDWALDAGATHRIRQEDGLGNATSDTIFLELRRAVEWRP
ncbi:MAG: hypothetical protein HC783_00625 [Rhodobacteraceae bacterium]|nr:hypothetical protein [Paracoccaceae bacterium]